MGLLSWGAAVGVAHAQTPPPPLSAYGALPATELVAVSPSGDRVAFVTVVGEQRAMATVDLINERPLGVVAIGSAKLRDLEWLDEERVLVTLSTTETLPQIGLDKSELYLGQVFNVTTGRIVRMLNANRKLFPVLMSGVYVRPGDARPDVLVRAYELDNYGVLNLYRVDPDTGSARLAERMSRDVEDFLLDDEGRSIARSLYDERSRVWSLQVRKDGRLQETWRMSTPVDPPELLGLGLNGDSVIVSAERPDLSREGREDAVFFDVDIASGTWRPVRFDFNPDRLLFSPTTRHLIGAGRMQDQGIRYAFADPTAAVLWASVTQVMPDAAPVLASWSDDMRTAVVFTSGAEDPGTYSLIDLDGGQVRPVGRAYPQIEPSQVAPMRPVQFKAADGLTLHGYLTTPLKKEARDLPLVVLAHGGPATRDTAGFDWWSQAIASRGYAVLQVNFRGSTGYGEAFMEAGFGEWGRKMQTDLSDGVRYLAGEGIVDPARTCIVGASYGGYAALAGPTLDPGVYRCAVSVAGVSNLRAMLSYEAERGERRDSSRVRYWNRFMGGDGPGDRSLDARSPSRLVETVEVPIQLLHGRDDVVVPISQSRQMADALRRAGKPHEFIELDGEDHWLSRAETRTRMLTETMRFIETHNPAR
ncbi:S9 family peptidase [Brevundimonas variabilis]|uniref:Dipeptidyl aminopeptidase/acylaminoacyl peptidase n=1 Tax=Brevundimonas variabilis TaxID=74312 RepID=A0A7W9CL15_9CAUL|nr:dipeptidyl aminopeptidase/acylaminoacyl peptidase [Brevundimonas variabilis]